MNSRSETLRQLSSQIRGLEQSALKDRVKTYIPSGFNNLDQVLPGGGWPAGSLIELLASEASGALLLGLKLTQKALETKVAWAVIDPDASFYPPAAQSAGLDTSKLILVRPLPGQAAWTLNQFLRCPDVSVSFLSSRSMDNMTYRRLQLAAERGQGLGVIVRPREAIRKPCWAAVRMLVEPHVGEAQFNDSECASRVDGRSATRTSSGPPRETDWPPRTPRRQERQECGEGQESEDSNGAVMNASAASPVTRHSSRRFKLTLLHVRGGMSGQSLILDVPE